MGVVVVDELAGVIITKNKSIEASDFIMRSTISMCRNQSPSSANQVYTGLDEKGPKQSGGNQQEKGGNIIDGSVIRTNHCIKHECKNDVLAILSLLVAGSL
jgi:hypothetical protein